jgi:tetratricopeptide (TPR) repeat protein
MSPLSAHELGALVHMVNQERLPQAEEQALALLKTHPGNGMLWKVLSVALLRQGKNAFPALRKTVELMPRDAEAHANLGSALLTQGQYAAALASLQRALQLRPHDVDTLLDAADALAALGRPGESVPLYRRALEVDPRAAQAHNNLGNALLQSGEPGQAAACYRRALELRPDEADIHCNLGNALRQLGQLEEAIACSRRAIALNPGSSMAHNNLGLALAGLGKREQAVASYRQALALKPQYVEALDNLGNALRDLGQRRAALEIYRQAVELAPRRPEAHCNIGNAFFDMRKLEEAATAFRQALALRAEFAPAHLGLALTLRQQRRPAQAEEACQAALRIDPNAVDALALLGELRADRGQFDQAEKLFRRALEIDPFSAFAQASIATHRKMTPEDAKWLRDSRALLARQLPLRQEVGLRYALGKYFDDLGEYDRAFEQFRCANELTRRHEVRYDRVKLTARVDQILRDFDAMRRSDEEPASFSETPVFIVGMPRSGTSLSEQILASHPAVFGAGEIPFWNAGYETYRSAQRQDDRAAIRLADLARDYLTQLASIDATSARVVDKMPANFMYAGLIHIALPRARIIHMQRHPLDTCLSIYFQNFFNIGPYTNDLDDLAHYYGEYVRLTNHWRAVLPPTAWLDVPYEKLIADQEHWSRRMLEFVGLAWDPKCLEFHNTDRVVITASKWQVRQKMSTTSAGRWRRYEKHVGPLRHLMPHSHGPQRETLAGEC